MKTNGNQLNDRQGRLPNGNMPVLLPTGFLFTLVVQLASNKPVQVFTAPWVCTGASAASNAAAATSRDVYLFIVSEGWVLAVLFVLDLLLG